MAQQFSSTDEPWSQIPPFEHDGVIIYVTSFAGDDHSAATTVFTSENSSEVFHADKHCHRLHQGESLTFHGEERRHINAWPLERVMTSWGNPVRPCGYCTQDIHTTAEIVQKYDNVPEACLKYFKPGDNRVTTTPSPSGSKPSVTPTEVVSMSSDRVCDACGETFRTLTKLRLHERNDCVEREQYGQIDPNAPDVGLQAAEGLLTCRNCGLENGNADFEETASYAAGDYHLIVEFGCRRCGFENENRVVMEGVDRADLERLPPHLQPDEIDGGESA